MIAALSAALSNSRMHSPLSSRKRTTLTPFILVSLIVIEASSIASSKATAGSNLLRQDPIHSGRVTPSSLLSLPFGLGGVGSGMPKMAKGYQGRYTPGGAEGEHFFGARMGCD